MDDKTTKLRHPCYGLGLSKKQREIFEQICVGVRHPYGTDKQYEPLINLGLIVKCGEKVILKNRFGTVKIPEYEAEISYHAAFCEWARDQPEVKDHD